MTSLTPRDINLLRDSWKDVSAIADTAAQLFYDRLFELDPALAPLFAESDMQAQRHKLIAALDAVIGGLDRPDALIAELSALGARHASYGTRPTHYDTVGAALLWTLGRGLGPRFTPDVRAAWTTAYALVAGVMREAGRRVSAA